MLRQAVHIILASTLLLYGCTATEAENTGVATDTVQEKTYIVQLDKDTSEKIYAWQGNLDGQYPVLMWYKEYSGVLRGSLFYTEQKNAGAIQIIGTITEDSYRILEMQNDGDITGVWLLTPNFHGTEGTWYSPDGKKAYNASLIRTDTAVNIPPIQTEGNYSGTYIYNMGEEGATGKMTVLHNKTTVNVGFYNVSAAPARNMAILDDVTLPLSGNEAIYQSNEYGHCSFRIRFFNGFAVVDYIEDKMDCGFGHNTMVSGIYIGE